MKIQLYNHWSKKKPLNFTLFNLAHYQMGGLRNRMVLEVCNFCISVSYGEVREDWVKRYNREHNKE